jgi:hypothetical protein
MELNYFLPFDMCFYINKILINDRLWHCKKSLEENLLFINPRLPLHAANFKIIDKLIIRICKEDAQSAIKIFGSLYYSTMEGGRVPFWISDTIEDRRILKKILHWKSLHKEIFNENK